MVETCLNTVVANTFPVFFGGGWGSLFLAEMWALGELFIQRDFQTNCEISKTSHLHIYAQILYYPNLNFLEKNAGSNGRKWPIKNFSVPA
jgi:hypothetical protein